MTSKKPAAKKPSGVAYRVVGAHSIDGVAPGGTVTFPESELPRARQLERAGAIERSS